MFDIELIFNIEPMAIQSVRSRVIKTKKGNSFVSHYQPKKNEEYKFFIATMARKQMENSIFKLIENEPISIDVEFVYQYPKSMKKSDIERIKNGELIYKITRGDLTDNLMKGLADALTGIIWKDDSLICRITSQKRYGMKSYIRIGINILNQDYIQNSILENVTQFEDNLF